MELNQQRIEDEGGKLCPSIELIQKEWSSQYLLHWAGCCGNEETKLWNPVYFKQQRRSNEFQIWVPGWSSTSCYVLAHHIVAAIFVLIEFVRSGTLKVAHSCTSQLQTFIKPTKQHAGSPVKAENIGMGLSKLDIDPRHPYFRHRPSQQDDYINKAINYTWKYGSDIAFRYSYGSANIQAASQDHDYLEKPVLET